MFNKIRKVCAISFLEFFFSRSIISFSFSLCCGLNKKKSHIFNFFLFYFFKFQKKTAEIKLLNDINAQLNERYEIKSNFNALKNQFKELETDETTRRTEYNKHKKKELIEMEHIGQELCHEHGKVIHQIEHINWHLSHAHPHEITTPIELPHIQSKICQTGLSGHGHGHAHGRMHCSNKPSNMVMKTQIEFSTIYVSMKLTLILCNLS